MTSQFNATETQVNMTLTGYFLVFDIGVLFSGSISDKFGRKPMLVIGAIVYTIGSLFCAFSWTIWILLACRVLQATGAGVMGAVATACIKDCFAPQSRAQVFAAGQIVFTMGPVIAPVIGGIILSFATWRYMFWTLTGIGIFCVILTLLFEESLPPEERATDGVFKNFGNMGNCFRIKGFIPLLFVSCLSSATYMSFVILSPYIFEQYSGFSAQGFSYFFAACALFTIIGPILYLRLCKRRMRPRTFTHITVAVFVVASLLLIPLSKSGAFVFFALCAIISLCQVAFRSYISNVLISEVKVESEVGGASSLMTFLGAGTGVLGMLIAGFEVGLPIERFTVIAVIVCILNLAIWIYYCLRKYYMHNLEHVIEEQI
jgi:DHA1 family bicyclomycin/chloramphenicol resistance-like MFS transporter